MQLRFATGGAAAGWAEVQRAAIPYLVASEESVLHELEHTPGVLARYVVVEAGEVLGISRVRSADRPGDPTRVTIVVHPDHRDRGVGRLLLSRCLPLLGEAGAAALVSGEDRSLAVARHWGFEPVRQHRISSVDPRAVPPPAATPDGLRVTTLDEAGVDAVHACHDAVAGDDPSGLSHAFSDEDYRGQIWDDPVHRPDLGRAVLDGPTVVAFSMLDAADGRAWNSMTGCLSSHRGRGLATLAKAHALQAAAAAGVTVCSTGNDEANLAMLAVDDRLGYTPAGSSWSTLRPRPHPRFVSGRRGVHRGPTADESG